jgi:hypothetical protein
MKAGRPDVRSSSIVGPSVMFNSTLGGLSNQCCLVGGHHGIAVLQIEGISMRHIGGFMIWNPRAAIVEVEAFQGKWECGTVRYMQAFRW